MVVAGGRISIIFISNGCVAACNLFIPGTTGSGTHINRIKKIGIWPLNEEFDALTAYFGAVYSVSQFYCNFFGDILTFQTLKEKTSSSNNSGPSCMSLPAFFFSHCRSLIEITKLPVLPKKQMLFSEPERLANLANQLLLLTHFHHF